MLFNSYFFIFAFLPITLLGYFLFNYFNKNNFAKVWLILASLYFYSYWNIHNLFLLISSILINFFLVQFLHKDGKEIPRKLLFRAGILFNLGLLGFFKYADFALWNLSWLLNIKTTPLGLLLPLGISFFTLQQIASLVDSYEGMGEEKNFLDYCLFVTFFPQLISGPITRYSHLMPQFNKEENKFFNSDKLALGIFIFCLGLMKKILLSDTFALWAKPGFDELASLDFLAAWKTSLSYTFQLYFDFSGYTDMAIGVGYMFNLKLPQNFNSPLRSKSVIEFWSKWHITLSLFITTYVFTPIVRSMPKITFKNTMIATLLAMLISGVWHGAGWTFVLYGFFHGSALVINHLWKKRKKKLPYGIAWLLTFNFINFTMIFFRAKNVSDAIKVLRGMLGLDGFVIPRIGIKSVGFLNDYGFKMGTYLYPADYFLIISFILTFYIIFNFKNSLEMEKITRPNAKLGFFCGIGFVLCLFGMNRITEFIYFNF
jgi:alginate O-acetyltransferase complex protein AlgI